MNVKLEAKPNHDYTSGERATLYIKAYTVKVSSFKEASEVVYSFIWDNNVGAGNWTGGDITDDSGNLLATVSYNGKVWDIPTGRIIYNPFSVE